MRILLTSILCCIAFGASAQSLVMASTDGWYELTGPPVYQKTAAFDLINQNLNIGQADNWSIQDIRHDELGFRHEFYQLERAGYPVDLSRAVLHWRNGQLVRVNLFAPFFQGEGNAPQVSANQAIQTAKNHIGATTWYWENPSLEAMRQEITGNPLATYAPQPELVWADTDFDWSSHAYRLAWKMELFSSEPLDCQLIYIDALTGEVIKQLSQTQHEGVPGTSHTMYRGVQSIVSDSIGVDQFRLRDYSRASSGILTLNLNNTTNLSNAVDFTNDSSDWDLVNPNWDEASGDVHWGSEVAYDIFLSEYGFDSFDGQGGQIRSHVHYGPQTYANAFWNVDHAGYGDDNGSPHVGIDIVGHEITHGVIRNTADLIYINEGASLNEGYADIFGNTIEALFDSASSDWLVGEDSDASRSMSNPRSIVYGPSSQGHPDTYQGDGWYAGGLDNGGAHGNSTVFGHWYYLVAAGGVGTNDLGDSYSVSGVGVQKSGQIAWRMLHSYLTPTAGFHDARESSIASAVDLFGLCSPEWQAVVNAWHAVGIGTPVLDDDIGMAAVEVIPSCDLDAAAPIVVTLKNYGCATTASGTTQIIYTLKDPFSVKVELLDLPNGIAPGESYSYTFSQTLDLSMPGDYEITATSLSLADPYQDNNESPTTLVQVRHPLDFLPITMESQTAEDTLAFLSGDEASITIEGTVGVDNSMGIDMEGGTGILYRLVDAFPMWGGPPVDLFEYNPDFSSQVCFCIGDPQNALFWFDRKQTYSNARKDEFLSQFPGSNTDSIMSRQGSVLRLTVDGTELARYYPQTTNLDDWTREEIDLSPYAGSKVQVCLEGKTIWSTLKDPNGVGDHIYLDNFTLVASVSKLSDQLTWKPATILYGSQSQDDQIRIQVDIPQELTVEVYDLSGKLLTTQSVLLQGGEQHLPLLERELAEGMYSVIIRNSTSRQALRWIVRK